MSVKESMSRRRMKRSEEGSRGEYKDARAADEVCDPECNLMYNPSILYTTISRAGEFYGHINKHPNSLQLLSPST